MYTIKTGTQYEPEVNSIFEAKIVSADLLNTLDKKQIYVYDNNDLVMIAENCQGSTEFHEIKKEDNLLYWGVNYG